MQHRKFKNNNRYEQYNMKPIVIIGTGLAGYTLAKEIRKLNQETPIIMITADGGEFYHKPQLSNALAKYPDTGLLVMATAEKMSKDLNLTILTHTCVDKIDSENDRLSLPTKEIFYSSLVLTIGATPIKTLLNHPESKDIISVNNLDDYFTFRKNIQGKSNITILGAGLVGCEFADDLVNAGYQVNVIAPSLTPLDTLTPPAIGKRLQTILSEKGVRWYLGLTVIDLLKTEKNYTLTLSNEDKLETEYILSAIGIQPNIGLAQKNGIVTHKGIVVNEHLQTNISNIFALGDCAEVNGVILPYIAPIFHCAKNLAKALLIEKTPVHYPPMPVIVKTPSLPILSLPPQPNIQGEWELDEHGTHISAMLYENGKLKGFVLTGEKIKEKAAFLNKLNL